MKTKSKYTKIALASLLFLIIISGLVLYLPYQNLKTEAEKNLPGIDKSKTYIKDTNLLNPEVAVFVTQPNGDAYAYFIKYRRNNLIYWEATSITNKSIATEQNLPEEEKQQQASQNLQLLQDIVKKGEADKLPSQDPSVERAKNDEAVKQAEKDIEEFRREGRIAAEITDSQGKNKILIVTHPVERNKATVRSTIMLNGKELPNIENVKSVFLSTDNKYLYYTKYEILEDNYENIDTPTRGTGKIYRLELSSQKEEEVYSFNSPTGLNIRATNQYILYTNDFGEIGVIDLKTKENKVLKEVTLAPGAGRSEIASLNNEYAIINPNDERAVFDKDKRQFKIDFGKLSIVEM